MEQDTPRKLPLRTMDSWTTRILDHCLATESANPMQIAVDLMDLPEFPVAGQAHHPLIAGALMAAYQNASCKHDRKAIETAIQRTDKLPAGFCAAYGADAGAIAAGTVLSVIFGNTIRAERSTTRAMAHQLTAHCLLSISNNTGNRCCKRTVFQVIETATNFIAAHLGVAMDRTSPVLHKCGYSGRNDLCNKDECRYFPGHSLATGQDGQRT